MFVTLYGNDFVLLSANKLLLNKPKRQPMDRIEMTDTGDLLRVFSMNVARDPEKETITINQRDYTENGIDRFGTEGCQPAYMSGVEPEVSLNQPEANCGTRRTRSVTNSSQMVSYTLGRFPTTIYPLCS